MKCPQCGSRTLRIEVRLTGFVTGTFEDDEQFELTETGSFRSGWEQDAASACTECLWSGTASELQERARVPLARSSRHSAPVRSPGTRARVESLDDVEELKETYGCDTPWEECLDYLAGEVKHLRAVVAMLERANVREGRGGSRDDTAIF
ncbi:MAG: hypothetical protein ACREQV_15580 [Candidatus Binatia bacterium]